MEEFNIKLKAEINGHLEYLLKKIGNNRQQLSGKVLGFYRDINKELGKEKADPKREEEIRREVSAMEKMAAKQLPHYEPYSGVPAPPKAAPPVPSPKTAEVPKPAAKTTTSTKAEPETKAKPVKAKPAAKSSKPAKKKK